MELAAYIGISITEFWQITPGELMIAAKSFSRRQENKSKEDIFQAYLISRWVWSKHINIDQILNAQPKNAVMSDDEMLKKVKALNALFGGEVKVIGEE